MLTPTMTAVALDTLKRYGCAGMKEDMKVREEAMKEAYRLAAARIRAIEKARKKTPKAVERVLERERDLYMEARRLDW